MKVLKQGTIEAGWNTVVTCTGAGNDKFGCEAELEIREEDLFHTYSSCMGRYEEHYTTIQCACCGTWTDIEEVPSKIRNRVLAKTIRRPNN